MIIMGKKNNGTLMIVACDGKGIGRKVFDIKITSTFPMIATNGIPIRIKTPNGNFSSEHYQHLSIPPDLNLHLTKSNGHSRYIFFEPSNFMSESGSLKEGTHRLFSIRTLPIDKYKEPRDSKKASWHGGSIIVLPREKQFLHTTGLLIDVFVHKKEIPIGLESQPFIINSARVPSGIAPNTINTFYFADIIRGSHKANADFYMTVRFSYCNQVDKYSTIDIPHNCKISNT